jgi:uncharacterized protein YecE (DUF72 family)
MIRIGTSGWQYDDWRGAFYPAGLARARWLGHYVQAFDTVEINATFYGLPKQSTVAGWVGSFPPGFLVAVKASRFLTHLKRLREPRDPVNRLLDRIAPLRAANVLGAVLLQLPPHFPARPDLLDETLAAFPAGIRVAVEPRDPSWFTPQVRQVLTDRAAALVWADRAGEPTGPLWETAPWVYLRLHHGRTDWSYSEADLRRWADRLVGCEDAFVYTNNDPGAAAVRDALRLRELITDR